MALTKNINKEGLSILSGLNDSLNSTGLSDVSKSSNFSRGRTIADFRDSPQRPRHGSAPNPNRTIPMAGKQKDWLDKYGDSFHAPRSGPSPPNYPSAGSSVPSDMAPFITDDSSHGFWNPFNSYVLGSSSGSGGHHSSGHHSDGHHSGGHHSSGSSRGHIAAGHVTFNVAAGVETTVNLGGPTSFNSSGASSIPSFNLPHGAMSTPVKSPGRSGNDSRYQTAQSSMYDSFKSAPSY